MQDSDIHSAREIGAVLVIVGATLAAAAIACALAAANHMAVAPVCGPLARHCLLCVISASSLLAALGVIGAGLTLRQTPRSGQAAVTRA